MATRKQLIGYAKKMRNNPTQSERKAGELLKKARIPFREQVPFKYYILDFIITNRLLVLEIDGGYHKDRAWKDEQRDKFCKKLGLKVLRIKNENVDTVVRRVKRFKTIKNYKKKLDTILFHLK